MESLLNRETVKRVQRALNVFNKNIYIQIQDKSAGTAIEAANSLSCEVGAIVKSLILKSDNSFLLCLISGDKRCSLKKVKKLIEQKKVYMANADDVKNITGFTIGGVSPIGHLNKIDILIDNSLQRFDHLFAAAGHPNCVFKMSFGDLIKITKGSIKELTE